MRIRRKPWARPELEACNFFVEVKDAPKYKGKWSDLFLNKNPIHLELGCGKGQFISKIALENPDINYIAVDIKSEMLAVARRNIVKLFGDKDVDNIKLVAFNIEKISDIFSQDDNIERIYINFCNPWPKDKHKKRRLTHTRQLLQYKDFLEKSKQIHFKTDDDELFNDSIEYFENAGFTINYKTYDLHSENIESNIVTEHEKMFSEDGCKIKFLIATKQ